MNNISKPLLKWYDAHQRKLPWRVPSAELKRGVRPDPYRVWLAEIMLQQTGVVTVKPYYEKFLKRWPSVEKLARADRNDVLAAWAGLGYYSRARNLHACAQAVVAGGGWPQTAAELQKLPGIGGYTAAAVAAIAFDEPAPVVDGNIIRVMARLHAVATPLPRAKKHIEKLAAKHTPAKRNGCYAQALMDIGATVCTPRNPRCDICPLRAHCAAYKKGTPEKFPAKAKKQSTPHRQAVAYVLVASNEILLRRRPDAGLLGGMAEAPSSEWHEGSAVRDRPKLPAAKWVEKGAITHVFSHFKLTLTVRAARITKRSALPASYFWVKIKDLHKQALPTVMRKVLERAEVR